MSSTTTRNRAPAEAIGRARAEELLARYPDVSPADNADILRFIKKGPPLDVALMSADERLKPQIDRFRQDHASHFSLGRRDWIVLAVLIAGIAMLCAVLWDAGAG